MANFLELVNDAIAETKASLDPLTSVNFDTPPRTVLYSHFKRWVNTAYTELYMKRPEWEFSRERNIAEIWPRLHIAGLTYTPLVGDVFTAQSSGVIFTVKAVHTYEDVELDPSVELTLGVLFATTSNPTNIILKETVTSSGGTGYIKGYGRYNIHSDPYVDQIDISTLALSYPPADAVTLGNEVFPLTYIPRSEWQPAWSEYPWTSGYGHPKFVTDTSDGNYQLYPMPARNYMLSYEYTAQTAPLVAFNDVPTSLPTKFHGYLMWRTVQEYADWNKDSALYLRAKKHVDEYLYWLDRDSTPKPSIVGCKFSGG